MVTWLHCTEDYSKTESWWECGGYHLLIASKQRKVGVKIACKGRPPVLYFL